MDPTQISELIFLVILLLLSSFFSCAETALTTVNKIRMRTLSEAGNKRAKRVLRITNDPSKMLSAILIGNNLVNISASALATTLAIDLYGNAGAGIATGILTFLILIFGEISPKTLATIHSEKLALAFCGIIQFLMTILTPVIFVINKLAMGFLFLLGVNPKNQQNAITEEELRTIVDVSQETGVIEDEEREMIHNLFDFGDSKVKEIMIPRIDTTFVSIDASYEEVLEIVREDMFTRIPVYEDSTDNVVGIINVKDLLLFDPKKEFHIRDIMREPFYTYEHKNTSDLFIEMRQSSISIAIVLDEYGTTAGLVTLEDLLEEIVGEIRDEYDTDEIDSITRLSDREYRILASTNLDDVNGELDIQLDSDDYDTIGGYVLGLLDHIPEKNEIVFSEDGILFRVDMMDKNRIEVLYVKLPIPVETEE